MSAGGENTGTVFANVRSKLSHFSPSDFFSNLTKRKSANKDIEESNSHYTKNHQFVSSSSARQKASNGIVDGGRRENLRATSPPSPILPIRNLSTSAAEDDEQPPLKLVDVELSPRVVQEENDHCYCDEDAWADLPYSADTLEFQHFGHIDGLIPTGKRDLGVGHEFVVAQLSGSTFCDKCGDIIWGLYKQAVRCQYCHYTCHYKCRLLVTLDCRSVSDSLKSTSTKSTELPDLGDDEESIFNDDQVLESPDLPVVGEEIIENVDPVAVVAKVEINEQLPKNAVLVQLIDEYNKFAEGLKMTMEEDGQTFRGFLQIHMNFTRPINIVAGDRPPSIYDVLNADDTLTSEERRRTITSFFLPRNTVKILHITSETTTREMIVSLLKKFKVADNPRKFALYERDLEPGKTLQARLRRFSDDACPLRIALTWGSNSNKRFVLQENDTGDILWDYFEVPELSNFLKILDREEQQYVWQIKHKYDAYRYYLQMELQERGFPVRFDDFDQQVIAGFANTDSNDGAVSNVDDGTRTPTEEDQVAEGTLVTDFKTALSANTARSYNNYTL